MVASGAARLYLICALVLMLLYNLSFILDLLMNVDWICFSFSFLNQETLGCFWLMNEYLLECSIKYILEEKVSAQRKITSGHFQALCSSVERGATVGCVKNSPAGRNSEQVQTLVLGLDLRIFANQPR